MRAVTWQGRRTIAVRDRPDPLDTASLAAHRLDLDEVPYADLMLQAERDGCIKVVLRP